MPAISIYLKADAEAAMRYLMGRWYQGQADKRNAVIVRALVETAERERQESELVDVLLGWNDCDCDGGYQGARWQAPHHAGNCPVYERWQAFVEALPSGNGVAKRP